MALLARKADLSTVAEQYQINWKMLAGIIRRAVVSAASGLMPRSSSPDRIIPCGSQMTLAPKGGRPFAVPAVTVGGSRSWS